MINRRNFLTTVAMGAASAAFLAACGQLKSESERLRKTERDALLAG